MCVCPRILVDIKWKLLTFSSLSEFNYTFKWVEDGNYGFKNKETGEWNGLMGELLSQVTWNNIIFKIIFPCWQGIALHDYTIQLLFYLKIWESWLWIFILSQKLFVSFTFCHHSYPLLNTEMDSFMKYYFTTLWKTCLCWPLHSVNFITLLSLYFGKTRC